MRSRSLLAVMTAAALAAPTASSSAESPKPVLTSLNGKAPMPTASGLAHALAGPLGDSGLGARPHIEVTDAESGKVLFDRDGRQPAIPASTNKLITAAAALTVLGPRTTFLTRVYLPTPPSGQAAADVYLVGGGDPTLSTQPGSQGYPAAADLGELARAVAQRRHDIGRVIAVGGQYGGPDAAPGWSASYLGDGQVARVRSLLVDEAKPTPGIGPGVRASDPLTQAGEKFAAMLRAAGAQTGPVGVGALPAKAQLVASVRSPSVAALVERMLNYSDADVAEGLGRQVALRLGLPPTFDGVATALTREAAQLGLPPGSRFADASGLSREDAIAPATLTTLLRRAVTDRPQLRPMLAALPIAGLSGTLAVRFTGSSATGAGYVRAKTGWLLGAAGLAGTVITADGRELLFAALAPAPSRAAGEQALDRLAGALASCGCR